MTEEEVRNVVEDLLSEGAEPTVRSIRERLKNGGSHRDLGPILRKILAEKERVEASRKDMPNALRDRFDLAAADLWETAQQIANQAAEDARRGADARVQLAEQHADQMAGDVDRLEKEAKEKDDAIDRHRQAAEKATRRASDAELKLEKLKAQLRTANERNERREREFDELYRRLDAVLAKA